MIVKCIRWHFIGHRRSGVVQQCTQQEGRVYTEIKGLETERRG